MKKLSIFALLVAALAGRAQEYPVSTGYIEDCGGFLVDNGYSASDYGPNENSTCTICHDGTGDPIVNLYFSFFDLGTGDQLSVYDGPDTGSPFVGTYSLMELQAQTITSTNPDGCLTVVFTSNSDSSVGSFGAEISCGLPCSAPFVIVTSNQQDSNPIRLCIGEDFTLDGSATEFAEGTALGVFTWDFDDGTENTTDWPNVTHSFDQPGAYVVQLNVTDNNACNSTNLPDVLVFVAPEPEMVTTADDYQVCIGQAVDVTGLATPVTWDAIPDANFGGALYIPDDQTQCFSDTLLFGGFEPGATIETIDDLDYFYINFEHTYMGDLVISFICPNGQSVAVHQQGGGGTHLGSSNEQDNENLPGTGWDYYWTPDATNGTWAESSQDFSLLMDNGNGIMALMPGEYQSAQPLDQLIGCPLNGAWTVEVCDMWGADDGFIFDWSVQFDASLYPELISFTPTIGQGCDSTYWEGPYITSTSGNCNNLVVVPTEEGNFTYTFTALDNHGCSYEQSIQIEAYPGPTADAGTDVPFCGDDIDLAATVGNIVNGITYIYNWTPGAPITGDNTTTPTVTDLDENTDFVFSVYPMNDPQCLITDTVLVFIPGVPESAPVDSLEFCAGSDAPLVAPDIQNGYQYSWIFEDEQQVGTGSLLYAGTTGDYVVVITEPVCGFTSETPFYLNVLNCFVIIPNIFTPNHDGNNDNLEFFGLDNFDKSTLRVYNRWGNLVYDSDNYQNNWSPSDADVAEGTYFFILGINKSSGMDYREGYIQLLRN